MPITTYHAVTKFDRVLDSSRAHQDILFDSRKMSFEGGSHLPFEACQGTLRNVLDYSMF